MGAFNQSLSQADFERPKGLKKFLGVSVVAKSKPPEESMR